MLPLEEHQGCKVNPPALGGCEFGCIGANPEV
jgi:hypothetical protein